MSNVEPTPTRAPSVAPTEMLVDPDFLALADQFFTMYREPNHGGAGLAVYLDGEPVIDIWAGWADRDKRWRGDTVALAMSTGKGVAATVLHRIAERGLIDYDEPVATYWPEFEAAGKADITVRDVLTHRSGLHKARGLVADRDDILDYDAMITALAATPADPRRLRTSGYHAVTFGWLVAEIVHRATGTPFIDVLRAEIAEPLGTPEFWYVVPPDQRHRIAKLFPYVGPPGMSASIATSLLSRFGPLRGPGEAIPDGFEDLIRSGSIHDSVMPGANGVFSARALARMYGAIANDGMIGGFQFLRPDTIETIGAKQVAGSFDYVLGYPLSFTLGYHRPVIMAKTQPTKAFGHYGVGGSGAFGDPLTGLSVALITNRLGGAVTSLADLRLAKLGAKALAIATKL